MEGTRPVSGVLTAVAGRLGAGSVTAVDVSRLALICTRLNAALRGQSVSTRRGDVMRPLGKGQTFDAIVCNPPWRPSASDDVPVRGIARAWHAGQDARLLINRICKGVAVYLRPAGFLLIVQASFCDIPATVKMLERPGLGVNVVARSERPIAELDARAARLQRKGPWADGGSTWNSSSSAPTAACNPEPQHKRQAVTLPAVRNCCPEMTTTMTRAELGAELRTLADCLACVDISDPEAPRILTHIVDRLAELASQEHEPEIVTALRTVAARCAEAAEAITARPADRGKFRVRARRSPRRSSRRASAFLL
jgi:release factor glutamine methyltransferase